MEDEEAHVPAMVDVVLPEEWGGVVLDPHASQLVVVDVVHLKTALCTHMHGKCKYGGCHSFQTDST